MVDDGVGGVARREQNRQPWPAPGNLIRKRAPVHPSGQNDIGKQQLDLRMLLDDLQSLSAIAGLKNTVSEIAQSLDGVCSQVGLVFHDQNGLAVNPAPSRGSLPASRQAPRRSRSGGAGRS